MGLSANGWDTVYALNFNDLNALIGKKAPAPFPFSFEVDADANIPPASPASQAKPTRKVSGVLSPPVLVPGGSGQTVFLMVAIQAGGQYSFNPPAFNPVTLQQIVMTLSVNLDWMDQGKPIGKKELKKGAATPVSIDAVVYNDDNLDPALKLGDIEKDGFFQPGMQAYFNLHPEFFSTVFSSVNLNDAAATGDFAWMQATSTAYSTIQPAYDFDPKNALFGILCMTGGAKAPALAADQLPGDIIPDDEVSKAKGVNSGFLISYEKFAAEVLLPVLPFLFASTADGKAVTTDHFDLRENTIQNNVALKLEPQTLGNGKKIDTVIVDEKNFSLTLDDTWLEMDMILHFEYASGLTVTVNGSSYSILTLRPNADGSVYLQTDLLKEVKSADLQVSDAKVGQEIGASFAVAVAGSLICAGLDGVVGGCCGSAVRTTANGTFSALPIAATDVPGEMSARVGSALADGDDAGYDTLTVYAFSPEDFPTNELGSTAPPGPSTISAAQALAAQTTRPPQAIANDAAIALDQIANPCLGKRMLSSLWQRKLTILGILLSTGIGAGLTGIYRRVEKTAKSKGKTIPNLDQLTDKALGNVVWPNTASTGYSIQTIRLNGAVQFGVKVTI